MAHKTLPDGRTVVDWEIGDPEGDRKYLMQAYQDFVQDLIEAESEMPFQTFLGDILEKWGISIRDQVDDFPRIWIKRPE